MFTNDTIQSLYTTIKSHIVPTPCLYSPYLSSLVHGSVYLKLENTQRTGSFKERGVLSFFANKEGHLSHVVTASAGNHAAALALHAAIRQTKATIFMPESTSNNKVSATQKLKANVNLVGQNYDEAYAKAQEFAQSCGAQYVHAYDDLDVIMGQATIAQEIHQQVQPDIIVTPVGGGGLIAGISQWIMNEPAVKTKVIGVQAFDFQTVAQALNKGTVSINGRTIAEGIAVKKMGDIPEAICAITKPEMCSVKDLEIEHAITMLMEKQKIIAEGAGATPVAAILKDEYRHKLHGKTVVLVISGGNIDISLLARLSSHELVESCRLCRMSLVIKDTPGSLSRLLQTVTKAAGNIVDIHHERSFASIRWNEVLVDLIIETKDEAHRDMMLATLSKEGYSIRMHMQERERVGP